MDFPYLFRWDWPGSVDGMSVTGSLMVCNMVPVLHDKIVAAMCQQIFRQTHSLRSQNRMIISARYFCWNVRAARWMHEQVGPALWKQKEWKPTDSCCTNNKTLGNGKFISCWIWNCKWSICWSTWSIYITISHIQFGAALWNVFTVKPSIWYSSVILGIDSPLHFRPGCWPRWPPKLGLVNKKWATKMGQILHLQNNPFWGVKCFFQPQKWSKMYQQNPFVRWICFSPKFVISTSQQQLLNLKDLKPKTKKSVPPAARLSDHPAGPFLGCWGGGLSDAHPAAADLQPLRLGLQK